MRVAGNTQTIKHAAIEVSRSRAILLALVLAIGASAQGARPSPGPAPSITSQPVSQSISVGQTASFSVVANGTAPLAYQWTKNDIAIAGATSASYTTPPATTADNGAWFSVYVGNPYGGLTSSIATLTVMSVRVPPTITKQPISQSVMAGRAATFSVTATGTTPLRYQWFKNGAAVSGATAASYTTPATTTADNGSTFRVVVSNSVGSATSTNAILTVNSAPVPPSITSQPVSQSISVGQTATFSVVANGTAPLAYQWTKNDIAIAGATSASYTTPPATAADNGAWFSVYVGNPYGGLTSSIATLTVIPAALPPVITTQPVSQTVNVGQTATFSVAASGTAPLGYQWFKNGALISGAAAASYTTPPATAADNGSIFKAVVSNSAGSATSNNAILTVALPPVITTQPVSQTVNVGQTATFSVAASGTAPLGYQWFKNHSPISGSATASYTTPPATTADNGAVFSVTVSNVAGSVSSNDAALTVNPAPVPPTITTQPVSQTVNVGQSATFLVAATGTAPLSYRWFKNGAAISGATAASYTTPPATTADNGALFSAVVSNIVGSATSADAALIVKTPVQLPSITTQPVSQTINVGQTATFSVAATGTAPLSYQWYKNGAAISGATTASYTTPPAVTADNGSVFKAVVSNSAGSVTSGNATLTVTSGPVRPSITTQPVSQAVNIGQSATFFVVASGSAPLAYQWTKNEIAIGGATSASYTTPAATTADNGAQFSVYVGNPYGGLTSRIATLTVTTPPARPVITTQPVSQTVNIGENATFLVVATGAGPLNYQWFKNGVAIADGTAPSYTTPDATAADNGALFSVVISNAQDSVTSNNAKLTVSTSFLGLTPDPSSLAFGNVDVGGSKILPVALGNDDNADIAISNVSIDGAGFGANGLSTGQVIATGQSATLNVTFAPAAAGSVSGSITIASNATNSPVVIPLTGTGAKASSVLLSWTASLSTVAGYNIYRGTTQGGPYTMQNSALVTNLTYTDASVQSGGHYFYVARSVDSRGIESADSNEASVTIP